MKLLRITKSKMTKNENSENVPPTEITKVVLIHWNVVNNDYKEIQKFCIQLFLINLLVNY